MLVPAIRAIVGMEYRVQVNFVSYFPRDWVFFILISGNKYGTP